MAARCKVEGGRWKVAGGRWKVEGGRWKAAVCNWRAEPSGFVQTESCVQFRVITVRSGGVVDGSLFGLFIGSYCHVLVRCVERCLFCDCCRNTTHDAQSTAQFQTCCDSRVILVEMVSRNIVERLCSDICVCVCVCVCIYIYIYIYW